jgi:peptidoglycan/LPS O-acetylase OafA/YrhL
MQADGWLSRAIALVTRPGWLGVDLFFVLSGFLITGRLLDRKHAAARDYYASFYARRALRILPLYYLMLAVVGSAMLWAGEASWSFLAASAIFAPNIAMLMGLWTTAPLALLWSLGIEEQVYLVWPFLVRSLTAGGPSCSSCSVCSSRCCDTRPSRVVSCARGFRSPHGSGSTASRGAACRPLRSAMWPSDPVAELS